MHHTYDMNIKLGCENTEVLAVTYYNLTIDGERYTWIEYVNEHNNLVDSILRTEAGETIVDAALIEAVEGFLWG